MDHEDSAGQAAAAPLSIQGLPHLHGGALCLDLVNTVDMRLPDPSGRQPGQFLRSYDDLARWGWHAGGIDAAVARALMAAGERDPAAGALALVAAFELREAIYRAFAAAAQGQPAPPADLDALRDAYCAA